MVGQEVEAWSAQEWAALAQLTKLTRLHIDVNTAESGGDDGYYDVLKGLKGLRAVGDWVWDTDRYLPLLQSSTQLTDISGGWSAADESVVKSYACPHVRELRETCGLHIPFAAFPDLIGVSFYVASSDNLLSLSRCCTSLQRLDLPKDGLDHRSTHVDGLTSAFMSFASFKHLIHLTLPACGSAALAAFVSAAVAAGAGAPKLQYLHMHVLEGTADLMQLPQLVTVCGVRELSVVVRDPAGSIPPTIVEVGLCLVGLSAVPKVSLSVNTYRMRAIVESAKLWATDNGLSLPAMLRVCVVPDEQAPGLAVAHQ